MLGLEGITVFAAYLALIGSTLLCAVYGILNWNVGGDVTSIEQEEEKRWIKDEIEIEDELSGGVK